MRRMDMGDVPIHERKPLRPHGQGNGSGGGDSVMTCCGVGRSPSARAGRQVRWFSLTNAENGVVGGLERLGRDKRWGGNFGRMHGP